MVAPNRSIRCYVIEVPMDEYAGRLHRSSTRRELLPWADPYIARLVQKLKTEIEEERAARRNSLNDLRDELAPPAFESDWDFEQPDRDSWPLPDEIY